MLIRATTKVQQSVLHSYELAWAMDIDHCMYFIDALVSLMIQADALFGDLTICLKNSDNLISRREEYIKSEGNIFTVLSDIKEDIAIIGVVFGAEKQKAQMHIQIKVDTNMCSIQMVSLDEKIEAEDLAPPDVIMSQAEILAHLSHQCDTCTIVEAV